MTSCPTDTGEAARSYRAVMWEMFPRTAEKAWCSPTSDYHVWLRRWFRRAVCVRCGYRR